MNLRAFFFCNSVAFACYSFCYKNFLLFCNAKTRVVTGVYGALQCYKNFSNSLKNVFSFSLSHFFSLFTFSFLDFVKISVTL